MSFTFKSLALLAMVCLPGAAQCLVGTKSGDGKIRFQAAEELQIEGNRRVRLMPVAMQQITAEEAKRFPRVELAQAGTIRADANHRLVRLDDAGKPSDVVLPDNFAPKTRVDAAAAQGRLAIQVLQSKKDKTGVGIPPEQFFVFIAGAEPDRLALAFVNRSSAFVNLDEQFAAMEGLAASFPDSPVKAEFRVQLQDRISDGVAAFENHGSWDDLLLTRRYAEMAQRAFPGDAGFGQLSGAIAKRIQMVDSTRLELESLAASGDWDVLLDAYRPFERYQWSFPDLMALRQTALEESARLHARRGTLLAERRQDADALRELGLALRRDPDNRETAKLFETNRVVASLTEAKAGRPMPLAAGSPQDLRFKRSLHDAERAIQDKDFAKADAAIQEARSENKEAPEILVVEARLLAARGHDAQALPLLDAYDRAVADPAAREAGNTARNDILYDLEKKRIIFKQQLQQLQHDGDYSKLRAAANQALELDPDDGDFLYYGGATAAVFRDQAAARERLGRYLAGPVSLGDDPQNRDRAFRILAALDAPAPAQSAGTPNWLSGRPLPDSLFYCPVSGAFQPPIEGIVGYKLKMNFQWEGNHLTAITAAFDDEKGLQNYRALSGGAEAPGTFFFGYTGSGAQVAVASTHKFDGPVTLADLRVAHESTNPPHLVDEHSQPRILFQDSAQFNPAVLAILEGPLATGIAGNSFFNPFIWDGLHYFTLAWDGHGRLSSAKEWNADNLVRFTWSGDRLIEIRAFRKDSQVPYYQRTISYSGTMILGESYNQGGKTGQIKYVYSGKVLQQAKVEDGGVHDGKTWTVRIR